MAPWSLRIKFLARPPRVQVIVPGLRLHPCPRTEPTLDRAPCHRAPCTHTHLQPGTLPPPGGAGPHLGSPGVCASCQQPSSHGGVVPVGSFMSPPNGKSHDGWDSSLVHRCALSTQNGASLGTGGDGLDGRWEDVGPAPSLGLPPLWCG